MRAWRLDADHVPHLFTECLSRYHRDTLEEVDVVLRPTLVSTPTSVARWWLRQANGSLVTAPLAVCTMCWARYTAASRRRRR